MKLKLLNAIKCDLNKSIINIGFAGAVLLTTVLAFTSSAYTDLATDKSYSVFESLFTLDKISSAPTQCCPQCWFSETDFRDISQCSCLLSWHSHSWCLSVQSEITD